MKHVVVALALAMAATGPTLAQPAAGPTPVAAPAPAPAETPASQAARGLLTAMTTGDEASFRRFLDQAHPVSPMSVTEWLEFRENLHALQFHALAKADDTHADIVAFDAARGGWVLFQVTVQADAPHAITGFMLRRAPRPADVPPPPKLPPAALAAATRALVGAKAANDSFSGVVLIAHGDAPVLSAAYGLADRAHHKPVSMQTQFRIGSMTKALTAVAIMRLAQDGKIDLSAPVGRYLPDYPNAEVAAKVTIDELLTHTGGVGDFFGPEFEANRETLRDPKDYVARFGTRGPLFPPGSRTDYSNYGYVLLGRIVEAASGMSYDDYLQRSIFAPAGMTGTGDLPETTALPRRAIGYTMRDGAPLHPAVKNQVWRGTPGGGGYSTAGDLLKFSQALMAGRLLDAEHLRKLTTGGLTTADGRFARYDFTDRTVDGRVFWGHGGGAPGQNAELRIFPDGGWVVIVLANRDPSIAGEIANFISDRLP